MFSFSSILERSALPLFLFLCALFLLLLLSFAFALPAMSRLDIAGTILEAGDVRSRVKDLHGEVRKLEAARDALLLPMRDPLYLALRKDKEAFPSPLLFLEQLGDISRRIAEDEDAIHVDTLEYDAEEGVLVLEGMVHRVGPSSMTILAQFLDAVTKLPSVASVTLPAFTRQQDPDGSFSSPFSVTLTFRATSSSTL